MNDVAEPEPVAEPLTSAERTDLRPYREALANLMHRYEDACQKLREYENHEHDLTMQLKRAREAVAYQEKRRAGLERRIITSRTMVRAYEDDESGIYE